MSRSLFLQFQNESLKKNPNEGLIRSDTHPIEKYMVDHTLFALDQNLPNGVAKTPDTS